MRWYRAKDGSQQLFITDTALEELAEVELHRAGLMPKQPHPVNIDAFIEQHLGVKLDYAADLEPGILGLTELKAGAKPSIRISRDLTDAALEVDQYSGTLGRWRATLAHEAAHVLLHGFLFELNLEQEALFDEAPAGDARLFRCLKRDVVFARGGHDPREVQANKGMAALLMPKGLFGAAARDMAPSMDEESLMVEIARTFEVSRQAGRIRLQTLGFLEPDGSYVVGILAQ
jgi:hypothetical protein